MTPSSRVRKSSRPMPRMAENFDKLDANGDGRVERSEMHNFRMSHRKHRCVDAE